MRCEAFEDRLQHLLDERQLPEEDVALADHAAACPTCRDVLDTQAGLFDTVRDWSVANLEVDLVDRVLVRAAAPSASQPDRRSWWPASLRGGSARWISIAVAAALLLVAWKGYEWYGTDLTQPQFPTASQPPKIDPPKFNEPQESIDRDPIEFGVFARRAAEDLGSSLALGVHYIHRGRAAVTGAFLSHVPRKSDESGGRSSSILIKAASGVALLG